MCGAELGVYLHYIILFSPQPYEVGTIIISILEKRKQGEWGQVACSARQLGDGKHQVISGCMTPDLSSAPLRHCPTSWVNDHSYSVQSLLYFII